MGRREGTAPRRNRSRRHARCPWLGLAALNAPIGATEYGVFRM